MEARPLPKQAIAVGTFAICLANAIALVTGNTSPLIVAGLIAGLGLGEAGAGLVLTCELQYGRSGEIARNQKVGLHFGSCTTRTAVILRW